jgi:hypothetical protein
MGRRLALIDHVATRPEQELVKVPGSRLLIDQKHRQVLAMAMYSAAPLTSMV